MPNQITIHIYPADQKEEGYMFDVYLDKSPYDIASDRPDPNDGGQRATTLASAIDMAASQAQDLIHTPHKKLIRISTVTKALSKIKAGIETDRFTMENIDALIKQLNQ